MLVCRMLILLCLSLLCLWFTICEFIIKESLLPKNLVQKSVLFSGRWGWLCVMWSFLPPVNLNLVLGCCICYLWEILIWNLQNLNALEDPAHQMPLITSCFILLPKMIKLIEKHHKIVNYLERESILSTVWQNSNCSVLAQQYTYVRRYLCY